MNEHPLQILPLHTVYAFPCVNSGREWGSCWRMRGTSSIRVMPSSSSLCLMGRMAVCTALMENPSALKMILLQCLMVNTVHICETSPRYSSFRLAKEVGGFHLSFYIDCGYDIHENAFAWNEGKIRWMKLSTVQCDVCSNSCTKCTENCSSSCVIWVQVIIWGSL